MLFPKHEIDIIVTCATELGSKLKLLEQCSILILKDNNKKEINSYAFGCFVNLIKATCVREFKETRCEEN